MEFGEKLQALRKSRDLTQEALAEQLYVSRTAISKWESGRGVSEHRFTESNRGVFFRIPG